MRKKHAGIISIILGIALLTVGVLMLPFVTDFGIKILYYVLALIVLLYTYGLLLPKCMRTSNTKQVLYIVEIVLDTVIALSLVINEFGSIINIKESMMVFGIVLWMHFLFSLFRGFRTNDKKYPFYMVVVDALGISFATYLFVKPPLRNNTMIIIIAVMALAVGVVSILYGIYLLKGKKTKALKQATSSKQDK